MAERRVINGYIVERQADGSLVTIGPAGGTAPQMPVDPTFRYQEPKARLDNQLTEAQIRKAALDASQSAATQPYDIRKAAADAAKAEAEAVKAAKVGDGSAADTQKLANLRALERQIAEVRSLYNQNLKGGNPIEALGEYLPFSQNRAFDSAGKALAETGFGAFRVPGVGSQSDAEGARFVEAYAPSASDQDSVIEQKLTNLENRLRDTYREMGIEPRSPKPRDDAPMAVEGATQGADRSNQSAVLFGGPGQDGGGGGFVPYGATMKTEANPQWKGVNQAVKGMIVAGRSPDEIKAFLNSKGIAGDAARGVDEAINYFRKTGKSNFGVDVEKIQVPMSGFEQFRNNLPQTRVGTALATAANAGGFGIPQMIAGGEGLDYLRSVNPKSAFAGDVAGVIGGTAALGKAGSTVAGKLAPSLLGGGAKSAAARQLATDAAYGGIYGGVTEGTPEGALMGAGTAALGSGLGMGIGQGLKAAIAPTGGQLSGIMNAGVRPTLGQRFVESAGPLGKAINGIEESMKSYPILGAAIDRSRQAARNQYQTAGFNNALSAIDNKLPDGVTFGPDAMAYTRKAFDDAYDQARSGMRFAPDGQFAQDSAAFRNSWIDSGALDSEGVNRLQKAISTNVGSRLRNGELTGDTFKMAIRDLNKTINNVSSPEVKKALSEYRTIIDDAARRNSDPNAVALMDKADLGYSQFKPIKEAARRAGSAPGEFTPQGLAAVERQQMGKTNAYLEGNTRMGDFIKQGQNLVDRIPNSGTPERLLTVQGAMSPIVGGLGYMNPATLAAAGLTLPYMPVVEKAAKALIAPRGGKAKKIGGLFGSRAAQKVLGSAGAGVGIGALPFYD